MNEELRPYGTDSTDPPAEPLTREEQYLSAIAGVTSSSDIPPKPLTRIEKYLNRIVENGGGGGGGGTTDYNDLSNKPKLNSVELSGNVSLSHVGAQAALDSNQMAAVNSGITSEKLETVETNISSEQAKTTGMTEGGSDYITLNGMRLYMGESEPTGTIPINSTWIYGSSVKSYQGGVGDNKFDEVYPDISTDIKYRAIYVGDGTFTLSSTVGRTTDPAAVLFFIAGNVSAGASSSGNGVWEGQYRTVTAVDGYVTIAYRDMSGITPVNANTMLNTGSSVDTYEPYEYGWV